MTKWSLTITQRILKRKFQNSNSSYLLQKFRRTLLVYRQNTRLHKTNQHPKEVKVDNAVPISNLDNRVYIAALQQQHQYLLPMPWQSSLIKNRHLVVLNPKTNNFKWCKHPPRQNSCKIIIIRQTKIFLMPMRVLQLLSNKMRLNSSYFLLKIKYLILAAPCALHSWPLATKRQLIWWMTVIPQSQICLQA